VILEIQISKMNASWKRSMNFKKYFSMLCDTMSNSHSKTSR